MIGFANIASIIVQDAGNPTRTSSMGISIVGSQDVNFTAIKDDVTLNWQTNYPEWSMDSTMIIGNPVTHNFSAPINNSLIPIILATRDVYDITVLGKASSAPEAGAVLAYPSGSKSFSFDFGQLGSDLETKLQSIPVFGGTLNNTFKLPNGVVSYSNKWEELDNNPDVIWAFNATAGLSPLFGLQGKIRLLGAPSFITDVLAVNAGIDLVLSGQINLTGTYLRDKANIGGNGNVALTGAITGSLEAGLGAPGILILQISGTTGITGTGQLTYKFFGNDVVLKPSITLGGLTTKIQFDGPLGIKWTQEWTPIQPVSLYTGPDIIVIDGP